MMNFLLTFELFLERNEDKKQRWKNEQLRNMTALKKAAKSENHFQVQQQNQMRHYIQLIIYIHNILCVTLTRTPYSKLTQI